MYSEGPSEVEVKTKHWPAPLKSCVAWQWLCKPEPFERVVTVAGGHPDRSVGMAQGPSMFSGHCCFHRRPPKQRQWVEPAHGLSRSLSLALEGNHKNALVCACAYTHTSVCMGVDQGSPWGSWPVIWQNLTIAVSRCMGSRAKQMDGPSGFG